MDSTPAKTRTNGRSISCQAPSPHHYVAMKTPSTVRTPGSQRGHDWFGLDTPISGLGSPNTSPPVVSAVVDRLPRIAHSDPARREGKHSFSSSNNWFGLDGAMDDGMADGNSLKTSEPNRAGHRRMVRRQCGAATNVDESQAPTNFRSAFHAILSPRQGPKKWQDSVGYANGEEKRRLPGCRWLVPENPRIHPVARHRRSPDPQTTACSIARSTSLPDTFDKTRRLEPLSIS